MALRKRPQVKYLIELLKETDAWEISRSTPDYTCRRLMYNTVIKFKLKDSNFTFKYLKGRGGAGSVLYEITFPESYHLKLTQREEWAIVKAVKKFFAIESKKLESRREANFLKELLIE